MEVKTFLKEGFNNSKNFSGRGTHPSQNDASFSKTHIEKLFCGAFFSKKATSLVEILL